MGLDNQIYCQVLGADGAADGDEFDVTDGQYSSDNNGQPKVFGFEDGSYGVFWVKNGAGFGNNWTEFLSSFFKPILIRSMCV